ncbi:MAG TPA: hypothetical protein VFE61_31595 [Candidatus Sulfotelmatobacter sp.]|jgi:uncharacterized membrane protein|nr:hypothetical protein [Candidatus Sulfotelmatobacter sp.]
MDPALAMPLSCPDCDARMPETAAFCPGCGRSMTLAKSTVANVVPSNTTGTNSNAPNRTALPTATTTESETQTETRASGRIGYFLESFAGAVAYFTFIPAIVFLTADPYRKNHFVRFHAIQCLLVWVVVLATAATLRLIGIVLFIVPVAGPLLTWLISVIAGLAAFVLWLVLVVKALQGELFKLPVLGDFAEHHAGPV